MTLSAVLPAELGLGCNTFGWPLSRRESRAVVDAAIDNGITHFDTADVYGPEAASERYLGHALVGRRDVAFIATKFGVDTGTGERARGSRAYLMRAVEASLARLRTDRIDLLYYHWPDGVTPLAETFTAIAELVESGKVGAVGCANLTGEALRSAIDAAAASGVPLAAAQTEYNLLQPSAKLDVIPYVREIGAVLVPYYPLAGGLLTGKYTSSAGLSASSRLANRTQLLLSAYAAQLSRLTTFAKQRDLTLLELALAACLSTPGIGPVIAGASSPEQVATNARASRRRLTGSELAALDEIARVPANVGDLSGRMPSSFGPNRPDLPGHPVIREV